MSYNRRMSSITCQHPPVGQFWDVDEWRCRACSSSLSFPPREPTPADAKELKRYGESYRGERESTRVEVEKAVEVVEVQETQLLACTCCKLMLPTGSFYSRNSPKAEKRFFRASRCKGCSAFQLRARRQQQPTETRLRDRTRAAKYRLLLTADQRAIHATARATNKAANNAAVRRYRQRLTGRPVMVQTAGRQAVHIKPVCKVAATCPLRSFCTVEGKGLV